MKRPVCLLLLAYMLLLSACTLPALAPGDLRAGNFQTQTPATPDQTATAAALIIRQALAMGATPAASAVVTLTATPDKSEIQEQERDAVAVAVAATLTAQPTPTPTATPTNTAAPPPSPTPTPNLDATQTAVAGQLAMAVTATLTAQPTPTPTATPTPDIAATQAVAATSLALSVAATLTALPTPAPIARVHDFMACLEPCNGNPANARRSFPAGVQKIYLEWHFSDIPTGARYTRSWVLQGQGEWVRYQCDWPGPTSGMDVISLSEPNGLHSGVWEVAITVNDEVLLREQLVVEGDWDYWFWAGVFDSCYGKRQ